MPEQRGASPNALTILHIDPKHCAAKKYHLNGNGSWSKTNDYDCGFFYRAEPFFADDLNALANKIDELRQKRAAILVRGALDQAWYERIATEPNYKITRRKNPSNKDPHPPHLIEVVRYWVMLDIDKWPLKPGTDLRDDPAAIITDCIGDILPPCFKTARCFWQLSNSAGLVPGILKVHLFFWLETPISNADLRAWFKYYAPHVDHSPFNAVQPHYICDPYLSGGDDPLPARTGWLQGGDVVRLPATPPRDANAPRRRPSDATKQTGHAATPGLYCETVADALAALGDGDGLSGFHAPLLAATMRYAIHCKRGRPRDDESLWNQLRKAIDQAPKRDGRDATGYLNDDYLRRITEGGFAFAENIGHADAEASETVDQGAQLPLGFAFDSGKLWFCDPADEDAAPYIVCDRFDVLGECEDGAGGEWGVVLAWRDAANHRHAWIIPRDLFHGEPYVIAGRLESQGLRCNYTKAAQGSLRRCLASLRPERRLTAVSRGGWHGMSFLLPDGERSGDGDVMLRPELQRNDLSCAKAGSLQDWQDQVARYAIGNSRLALFISAAFSGSLLDIISEPSGGLHLHGMSQKGKSTAAFVAGSVAGKGARDGAVHQWRATGNGLEGVAARCSDACLVLDEISQADAREAGDSIYMLADGQGKQRAAKDGSARQRATWRIMFLSTGEVTLSQRMSDANKRTMTGMEVRLVNIPSDAGAGMGIFENLHDFSEPPLLADHLRHAAARCYGTAGRVFLSQLVAARADDPDGLYELIKALRTRFITDHCPAGSDGQVRSVAGRLGVIAAAGELATAWTILPWQDGEATQAAATCFKAWLAARGGTGAGEEQGAIRQVRQFIEAHGASRFTEIRAGITYHALSGVARDQTITQPDQINEPRTLNRVGWRKKTDDQWTYFVLPEAWKAEVCKGIDSEMAAKALADKGWLERGDAEHLTKQMSIPEHGRPRVYVLSGLLDGEA